MPRSLINRIWAVSCVETKLCRGPKQHDPLHVCLFLVLSSLWCYHLICCQFTRIHSFHAFMAAKDGETHCKYLSHTGVMISEASHPGIFIWSLQFLATTVIILLILLLNLKYQSFSLSVNQIFSVWRVQIFLGEDGMMNERFQSLDTCLSLFVFSVQSFE